MEDWTKEIQNVSRESSEKEKVRYLNLVNSAKAKRDADRQSSLLDKGYTKDFIETFLNENKDSIDELSRRLSLTRYQFLKCVRGYGLDHLLPTKQQSNAFGHSKVDQSKVIYHRKNDFLTKEFLTDFLSSHTGSFKEMAQELNVTSRVLKYTIDKFNLNHLVMSPEEMRSYILKKSKLTMKQKYGVDNPSLMKFVSEKRRNIFLQKYGVTNPFLSDEVQQKTLNTLQEKYGVSHNLQIKSVKDRIQEVKLKGGYQRLVKKLNTFNYQLLEPYQGLMTGNRGEDVWRKYKILCTRCGTVFEDDVYNLPHCPHCFNEYSRARSQLEQVYCDYLNDHGVTLKTSVKGLCKVDKRPAELDIYCPNLGIAFEINGLYWHSCGHIPLVNGRSNSKSPDYHQQKTLSSLKNGIKLFHIWDYQEIDLVKGFIDLILSNSLYHLSQLHSYSSGDFILIDRDWCPDPNDAWCIKNGYIFIEDVGPQCKYTDFNKMFDSKQDDLYPFYNSGMLKFKL